jgi:hypothetical protein
MQEKIAELNKPPRRVFLDLSSNCSGFAIASFTTVDNKAVATIHKAGVIWFSDEWNHGQKYKYIVERILDEFYIQDEITDIIHEKYSVSLNQRGG